MLIILTYDVNIFRKNTPKISDKYRLPWHFDISRI